MKNGRKFGLLVAVLTVGVMAAPAFAASGVTVGDFVKNVAGAMKLPATDAPMAEASLRAAGFALPRLDRSATLTEGSVAAIANAVGLHVASSNPAAGFSQTQVDRFMTSMSSNLSSSSMVAGNSNGGASTEWSRSSSGKGKKKPHSKSPKKPKKPKHPKKPSNGGHHGGGHGHGHGHGW